MTAATVRYCYGIAHPFTGRMEGVTGIQGAEVRTIEEGALVALVSSVPAAEFDEAALRARLEDLSWLEGVARAHNAVVDWLVQRTSALPFRLATIYLDDHRVREVLRSGHVAFSAALDLVAGRVEWGVKVYTEPASNDPGEPAPVVSDGRPGASYLRRRMSQRRLTEQSWQRAVDSAQLVDVTLTELAQDRRMHRPQSAELSGVKGHNVLNVAYLVPKDGSDEFLAHVDRARALVPDCRVEVTGPWAPYSFALDGAPQDEHT